METLLLTHSVSQWNFLEAFDLIVCNLWTFVCRSNKTSSLNRAVHTSHMQTKQCCVASAVSLLLVHVCM